MSDALHHGVTRILAAVQQGDSKANERLWALVYGELHALAEKQLADESRGHRRQATSLIQDVYVRMAGSQIMRCSSRREFFAAAARAMRQIRIDDARKRNRLKRGGNWKPTPLDCNTALKEQDPAELLAVDEALATLERRDTRKAEVVMLRYFGGLTVDECANALGISPRTVESDWQFARAWLHRALTDGGAPPG